MHSQKENYQCDIDSILFFLNCASVSICCIFGIGSDARLHLVYSHFNWYELSI